MDRRPGVAWTPRTRDILITLTHKVRYLSLAQLARTWWSDASPRSAERALRKLVAARHLQRLCLPAHPELDLVEPVVHWRPGDADPPFGPVAYSLQSRWVDTVQPTVLYLATARAASRLGGAGGKVRHLHQITHDLHLTQVYLHFRSVAPEAAACWLSEDMASTGWRWHEKLPDAILQDAEGRPALVIEFGGAYDARRVEAFHRYCMSSDLPYQLW